MLVSSGGGSVSSGAGSGDTNDDLCVSGDVSAVSRTCSIFHKHRDLQAVIQFRDEEQNGKDEDAHICGSIVSALQSYWLDQCGSAEDRLVAAYEVLVVRVGYTV